MIFNNKGFTLVELLGVIVVLVAILLIAIPNISSTLERNKNKIDYNKEKNIISAAEIAFSNNSCNYSKACIISFNCLLAHDLISDEELIYSNGTKINEKFAVVVYNNDGSKKFELKRSSEFDDLNDCCCCD